jgi:hypothetical protein
LRACAIIEVLSLCCFPSRVAYLLKRGGDLIRSELAASLLLPSSGTIAVWPMIAPIHGHVPFSETTWETGMPAVSGGTIITLLVT